MKANSIFFRGALAVAVSASCGYAAASTIGAITAERVTAQRVLQAADGIGQTATAAQTVAVTLGAQYSTNGRATLTLTNGRFGAAAPATANCLSGGADTNMTLVLESGGAIGSSSATYLVTGVSAGSNTISDICTFSNVQLQIASLTGKTKVEFSAKNNLNADIDTTIGSAILASVMDQFAFTSTATVPLDGIIDVQNDLQKFTTNSATSTPEINVDATAWAVDTLAFTVRAISVGATNSATIGTFETVIAGDFSFVKDADAVCSAGSATSGVSQVAMTAAGVAAGAANYGVTMADGCQSLTVKLQPAALQQVAVSAGAPLAAALSFYKDGATTTANSVPFAPVTAFNTSGSKFGYGTLASGRSVPVTIGSLGTWTTNGTTIDVPYMPFGQVSPAISHVITLNNRSGSAGAIRVSAWRAAGTYGGVTQTAVACGTQNFSLGTIDAATVKNITSEVTNYVQSTCGWGTGQTRVALRFDVATPAASTELYSSFTIDGTRSNVVVNSSNGRGSSTR